MDPPKESLTPRLKENLAAIRMRIERAAAESGRLPRDVQLVAVTKYLSEPVLRALAELGCETLGESRPQELWSKAAALADLAIDWHMVGHLQRNKIRRTLPLVSLVHSVDSPRLLAALDDESLERPCRALLEVNVSAEPAKHGFSPESLPGIIESLPRYANVRVVGLMCMASLAGGEAAAQRDFERLRTLRDSCAADCPPGTTLDELSMGMSGDFEAAIREGATIVRIGSALVEGIE